MKRSDRNWLSGSKLKGGLTLTITLFLAGCGLPLSDTTISSLVNALAKDNASACIQVSAGGGAGVMAIAPVPTIPAGGGYASLVACRSNEPGSIILVKQNGDLELYHGMFKIPVEERELRELRERIEKFEEIPSVFIFPGLPGEL